MTNALFEGTIQGNVVTNDNPQGKRRTPKAPTVSDYENVYSAYFVEHVDFRNKISTFLTGSYDLIALPLYALAKTMELSLYQSFINFANKWMDFVYTKAINESATDDMKRDYQARYNTQKSNLAVQKTQLINKIKDGTDAVMKVFKDTNNLPSIGTNKLAVNARNKYIRALQINCLDLVALWPGLYPDEYLLPLQLDKTRVVFSDTMGPDETHDGQMKVLNILDSTTSYNHQDIGISTTQDVNSLLFYPRKELLELDFAKYISSSSRFWVYGFGLKYSDDNFYRYGDNDPSSDFKPAYKWFTKNSQFENLPTYGNPTPITNLNAKTQVTSYLDALIYYIDGGTNLYNNAILHDTGGYIPGYPGVEGYGMSNNEPLAGQKLNALYPIKVENVSGSQGKLGTIAAYVPLNLQPENIIGDADPNTGFPLNVIKGFPFEKYGPDYEGRGISVVKEWINGANAVKLSTGQSVGVQIKNITKQNYQIRTRYASNNSNQVYFNVDPGGSPLFAQSVTFESTTNVTSGQQGENGRYTLKTIFSGNDLLTVEIPVGNFYVHVTNKGSSDIFLDRLEFSTVPSYVIYSGDYDATGTDDVLLSDPHEYFYDVIVNGTASHSSAATSMNLLNKGTVVRSIDIPGHSTSYSVQYSVPEGFDEVRILSSLPDISGTIRVESSKPPVFKNDGNSGDGGNTEYNFNFDLSGLQDTGLYSGKLKSGIRVQGNYTYTGAPSLNLVVYRNNSVVSTFPVGSPFDITITTETDKVILSLQPQHGLATVTGTGTITIPNDKLAIVYDKLFKLPHDLENIRIQVNALFISSTQNELAKEVNDHDIEEVALKVDALSDEVFGKEKKELRKLVNQAKRLSKARNLLVGGNFDNWEAWYKGKEVARVSDHELLKSDHVLLPPPTMYPSYIYQKVEETKLKPNTRYMISGFIAHAEDLEIVVSRYGQEVRKIVQVPYGEAFPLTSNGSICCTPSFRRDGKLSDPHFFSYSIDVGELDMTAGPGIELGLRIVDRLGMARVSNLEIREDRSLTANEIRKVQRMARNWRTEYEKERAEVTALIEPVLNQINALYENGDWNGSIRSDISYYDIESIVLPTLPRLRHWFVPDMLTEHGNIMNRFEEALNRAYTQLEGNTLLHNGHFTTDAVNWMIQGDAHQVILEDGRRVLRLPDWSSSVSQTIEIEKFDPDKEYNLVFHAQGEGTVTLEHGEKTKYIETHTHHFANFTTSQSQGITFESNKVTVEISSEDGELLVDHIALVEVPMFNKNQMVNENRDVNINSNTNMNNSNNQ
ncbi:delta endotoxin C-terminal domain-containing protein [Bacillus thuringiensis]|uniref:delta endotoxin C-terminal domain-containing protein n=1 Tax=Bacillus thuringiensis TaxID=1428 RepID=UPI00211D3C66|nr:delta endotoxin C-terminal domain-containing protein [Bacillus thuringiensis]